jgi:hypothetical protein
MGITKLLWILICTLFIFGLFGIAHADYIETMGGGIYHKENPMTCIMEPEPELQERFYGSEEGIEGVSDGILILTIDTIYEWSSSMRDYTENAPHFKEVGWYIPTKLVPYEEHHYLMVYDYPDCNIFIEYSKENTGQHIDNKSALGYTQIDFSKSKHQWVYVMIYLDSIDVDQKIHLCIGCDNKEQKLEIKVDVNSKPMPKESIHKILRHEFGHALGIGHYIEDQADGNNVDSIMYPNFNPFKPIVYDTIPIADKEVLRQIYQNDGFGGLKGYHPKSITIQEIIDGALDNLNSKLRAIS